MDKEILRTLVRTAKGEITPDTIIRNGKIVNVFTNEIEEGKRVVIKDGFIVSVEEDREKSPPREGSVIDAKGLYLCPGFLDSHTHLDSMVPFHELVPYALKGGTTTIISETTMASTSCGIEGLNSFTESTKGYPLRCFFVVAPHAPPFPTMESSKGLSYREFMKALKREDVLGIGESYWTRVADGDDRILAQAALAQSLRKTLEGHAAGARGNRLVQYLLTGITSCHESTTVDEALEKLRLGVYVMIREGWVRRELAELSGLKDMPVDERRLILVSDVLDPVTLCDVGYMDWIVRSAIQYGFHPMQAIKMATINPADYWGLRYVGAIAPLRHADILFLKDLRAVSVEQVMVNGEVVVSEGAFRKQLKPYEWPEAMMHSIETDRMHEDDFRIKAQTGKNQVRVIEIANETITKETLATLNVAGGYLQKDVDNDIIPIAVINRAKGKKLGKGFIKGTGIKDGAVATTIVWDTCNIVVMGSSEKEMELAANRMIDIQGGYVIVKGGKVTFQFPMPVYGLIAPYCMTDIKEKTEAFIEQVKTIGARFPKPFLTLQTIPFTGLPFLRITDRGLADVRSRKLVSIFKDV